MRQFLFRIFSVILTAFILPSCGDKTPDEYRKEKLEQEISRLGAVAGSYRGTLQVENESIPMELRLRVLTGSASGGDVGSNAQASLTGDITLYKGAPSSAAINNASFSSSGDGGAGNFGAQVSVVAGNGVSLGTLALSGVINGAQFQGTISPHGRAGSSGNFVVVKDAPLPKPGQPSEGPDPAAPNERFEGSFRMPCDSTNPLPCRGGETIERKAVMVLQRADPSSADSFLQIFVPRKTVNATLILNGASVVFPSAQLDRSNGILSAESTVSQPNFSTTLSLFCRRQGQEPREAGWQCRFTSSYWNLEYLFLLTPSRRPE